MRYQDLKQGKPFVPEEKEEEISKGEDPMVASLVEKINRYYNKI